MLDAIVHFLLLPVVGWCVLLALLSCTLWTVTSSNWFWASVLHVAVVWFATVFLQIAPSFDNLVILAVAYFVVGAVNSVLQWYFAVRTISKSFAEALVTIVKESLGSSVVDKLTSAISSKSSDSVIVDKMTALSLRDQTGTFSADEIDDQHRRAYDAVGSALCSASRSLRLSHTQHKILQNSVTINRADCEYENFPTVGSMRALYKPVPSANKAYLVAWIVFWPTILMWTALSKPIRFISNYVYDTLGSIYQRIADSAFK